MPAQGLGERAGPGGGRAGSGLALLGVAAGAQRRGPGRGAGSAEPTEIGIDKLVTAYVAFAVMGWTIASAVLNLLDKIKSTENMHCGIGITKDGLTLDQKKKLLLDIKEYSVAMIIVLFLSGVIMLVGGYQLFKRLLPLSALFIILGLVLFAGAISASWRARKKYWLGEADHALPGMSSGPAPDAKGDATITAHPS